MSQHSKQDEARSDDDIIDSTSTRAIGGGTSGRSSIPNSLDASIRQLEILENINEGNNHHENDIIEKSTSRQRSANYKDHVRASQGLLVATGTGNPPPAPLPLVGRHENREYRNSSRISHNHSTSDDDINRTQDHNDNSFKRQQLQYNRRR